EDDRRHKPEGDQGPEEPVGKESAEAVHGKRPAAPALRAPHAEIEAADLELLVRVRRKIDVPLKAVVLVRLDHDDPGVVLEEDPGHLPVRLVAELLVQAEA